MLGLVKHDVIRAGYGHHDHESISAILNFAAELRSSALQFSECSSGKRSFQCVDSRLSFWTRQLRSSATNSSFSLGQAISWIQPNCPSCLPDLPRTPRTLPSRVNL